MLFLETNLILPIIAALLRLFTGAEKKIWGSQNLIQSFKQSLDVHVESALKKTEMDSINFSESGEFDDDFT